jgi:uncharacterized protein YecE (DUF72 family)
MLYLGCPMWANKAWVGTFFPARAPQRDFLALYARRLPTVEGNTTFYAIPSAETVQRWRAETPAGFKFCLKFPQSISHHRRLRAADAETHEFVQRLADLGDRCGPSFLQLPPTFSARHLPDLAAYLDSLPPLPGGLAVEVRHRDFFAEPAESGLHALLRQHGAARVLYDQRGLRAAAPLDEGTRVAQARKPDVPVRFDRTAPFAFVRYISHPDLPANAPLFDEWARHVAAWLQSGDDVFFFCHHKQDFYAPALCRDFHAHVARQHHLPPLLAWDAADPPAPTQGMPF